MATSDQGAWAEQQLRYLQERQKILDDEHLRLLAVAYYIMGAIAALYSCFFILYVVMGVFMSHSPGMFLPTTTTTTLHGASPLSTPTPMPEPDPRTFGKMFSVIGGVLVLIGWTFAALTLLAGRCIVKRTGYTFVLVIGGLNCLLLPIGTALGVATFIVMLRPSVSSLFGVQGRTMPYPPGPPPGYGPPVG